MPQQKLYDNLARYRTVAPTLGDKDGVPLRVSSNGTLLTAASLPIGSGSAAKGVIYGQPARYNSNLLNLSDGDPVALQVDINGNLIITS